MVEKRDTIDLNEEVLYYILFPDLLEDENDLDLTKEISKFEIVQSNIVGHDEYDGGAEYTTIIKELETNKFYRVEYNDWDTNHQDSYGPYSSDVNLDTELVEVFPEVQSIIVYK